MQNGAEDLHYSYTTFDETLLHVLQRIAPEAITDIGAGSGKYARLFRANSFLQSTRLTAVEAVASCEDRLQTLYDEVIIADAGTLMQRATGTYDTVILGDVIEHMRLSDGLDLLHYLHNRSAYIIIITPEAMPQNIEGNFYASHNSIWRPAALATFDLFAHVRVATMHFYVIRGYLGPSRPALSGVVEQVNGLGLKAAVPGRPDETTVQLELHDTVSKDAVTTEGAQAGLVWFYRPN